jgi:hypothetical protein
VTTGTAKGPATTQIDWGIQSETSMAGATKRMAKAAAALVTSRLVEKAIRKAAADPRVRRKAAELTAAAGKKVRAAGKKATALARAARKQAGNRVVGPARKSVGKTIKRLGKVVEG